MLEPASGGFATMPSLNMTHDAPVRYGHPYLSDGARRHRATSPRDHRLGLQPFYGLPLTGQNAR